MNATAGHKRSKIPTRMGIWLLRILWINLLIPPLIYLGYVVSDVRGRAVPQLAVVDPEWMWFGLGVGIIAIFIGWVLVDKITIRMAKPEALAELSEERQSGRNPVPLGWDYYIARLCVRMALFEGAVWFNIYCYWVLVSWQNLVMAIALLISMFMCWPSTSGVARWVEEFPQKTSSR